MTNQDAFAAVELFAESKAAQETAANLDRTCKKMATDRRKMHNEQQAAVVARALLDVGGTFEFTEDHKRFGYSTIFSAMAGDLHDQSATPKEKALNSDEFEHVYRQGLVYLNNKLMQEWNSTVIYAVPRKVDDKAIAFITTNPDLVVNDNGDTAVKVFFERERKRSRGQLQASATKLVRSQGEQKALNTLLEVIDNVKSLVQLPSGAREGELQLSHASCGANL